MVQQNKPGSDIVGADSQEIPVGHVMMLGMLIVLLVACYYPMLLQTAQVIVYSDDMAHGFFAPIVALFIVWTNRDRLFRPVSPPSVWSLGFGILGACIGAISTLANSSTFSRFGFLISLIGCLLVLGGMRTLRQFLFPLALLLFTFPVPDVLYGEITQPLQMFATRLSEAGFELLGFSVIREGNVLQLTHMSLSVVEACSGLRSLITLLFFCVVYAYFFEDRLLGRIGIALLAIPSAIAVNAMRITATGVLGKYNLAWSEGTYHEIVGWTAFAFGFLVVLAAHRAYRRVVRTPPMGMAS